jgi:hypothetical protein
MEISEGLSASIFTIQVVQEDLNLQNCGGKIQTLELLACPGRFQHSAHLVFDLTVIGR